MHVFSTSFRPCSLAFCAALLLAACKQDVKPATTPTASAPVPAEAAKPELYLYAVSVDKLNLRDQPNKDGKVVAQFPEGEFVEGTGKVSDNKEEVTLRGISWNEPYWEVKQGASTGWAYSAALQTVYRGALADSPDRSKLAPITAVLKTLNPKKLDSGKKAWDCVKATLGTATGSTADAAFILLEKFLSRMEREGEYYKMTENLEWSQDDYQAIASHQYDVRKNPVTKPLLDNGFTLAEGEGTVFPVPDWDQLHSYFGPRASPAMKAFLNQEATERNANPWNDGGIAIELNTLADWAAFWEKFNRENPYFPLNAQTLESERYMRLVLVNGSDNTPTYNYETLAIEDTFKTTWAYIQQKYPGTELARAVKDIADLCAAEGWKRTKKVEDFQMKYTMEGQ